MSGELHFGKDKKFKIDFSKIKSDIKKEDLLKGLDSKYKSIFERIVDDIDASGEKDGVLSQSELARFFNNIEYAASEKDKTNLSEKEAKDFHLSDGTILGKNGKDALFALLNKLTEFSKDVKVTNNDDGSVTKTYSDDLVEQEFPDGKIVRTEKKDKTTTVTTTENGVETEREETTEIGDWTQKTSYEQGKKTKQVTTSGGTTYEISYDSEENPTTQVVALKGGVKKEYKYNDKYPNSWQPVERTEEESNTIPQDAVIPDNSQSPKVPAEENVVSQIPENEVVTPKKTPKNQEAKDAVLERVDKIMGGTRTTVTEFNNGESFYETVTEEVDGKTTVQEFEYKKDKKGNSKRCLASETDENGNVKYYTNDKNGNHVKSVETKGSTEIITEYENNKPKLVKEIDHQNHTVKNTSYNADGSYVVAEYSGVTVKTDKNGEYKLKADSKESYSEKLTEYDNKGQSVVAAKAEPVVKSVSVNPQREAMLQDEASRTMVTNYEIFAGDPLAKCNSAYQIAEVLFAKEGRTQITREEYERRAKQIMADNPGMFTEKGMRKFYSKEMTNTIIGCKLNLRMQPDVALEYAREHNRISDIRTMGKEASSARKEGDLATALFRTKASGKNRTNIYKDVISKINSGNVVAFLKSVEAKDKDTGNAFGFINKAFSNETIKKDFLDKVRTALVARAKELKLPKSEIKKLEDCINISNINDTKTMNAVVKTILSLLETVQNTAPSERSAVVKSISNKNAAPKAATLSDIAQENMDEANAIVDDQVKNGTWTEKLFDKLWCGEHCSAYTKDRIAKLKKRMDSVRTKSMADGKLDEVLFKKNFRKEFGTAYNPSLMNAYQEVQQQLKARVTYEDFSKNFAKDTIAQLDEGALRAKLIKYFGGEDCKEPKVKQMIEDFKNANKEGLLAFVEYWQQGLAEKAPYKDCVTLANELKGMNRQVFGVNADVIGDANEFVKVVQRGGMATQAVMDIASIMLFGGAAGWTAKALGGAEKVIATTSKAASLTTAAIMPFAHEHLNASSYADAHVGDLVYEFDKNGNPIIDEKTGEQKTHLKTRDEAYNERANYLRATYSSVINAIVMAGAMGNAETLLSQVAEGSLTKVEAFTALLGFDFTTAVEMGLIHGDGNMSEEEFWETLAIVLAGEGLMAWNMRGNSSKVSKTAQESTPVNSNKGTPVDVVPEYIPVAKTPRKPNEPEGAWDRAGNLAEQENQVGAKRNKSNYDAMCERAKAELENAQTSAELDDILNRINTLSREQKRALLYGDEGSVNGKSFADRVKAKREQLTRNAVSSTPEAENTATNAQKLQSLLDDLGNVKPGKGLNTEVSAKLKEVLPKLTNDTDIEAFLAKWKEIKNPSKSDKTFVRETLESKGYVKDANGNFVKKGSTKSTGSNKVEESEIASRTEEPAVKEEAQQEQENIRSVEEGLEDEILLNTEDPEAIPRSVAEEPDEIYLNTEELVPAQRSATEAELANRTFANEAELDAFMEGYDKGVIVGGGETKQNFVYRNENGERFYFEKTSDGKLNFVKQESKPKAPTLEEVAESASSKPKNNSGLETPKPLGEAAVARKYGVSIKNLWKDTHRMIKSVSDTKDYTAVESWINRRFSLPKHSELKNDLMTRLERHWNSL